MSTEYAPSPLFPSAGSLLFSTESQAVVSFPLPLLKPIAVSKKGELR